MLSFAVQGILWLVDSSLWHEASLGMAQITLVGFQIHTCIKKCVLVKKETLVIFVLVFFSNIQGLSRKMSSHC